MVGVRHTADADAPEATADDRDRRPAPATIALVGNPNVGKSSLFNALTGARRAAVGNWPGSSVEVASGQWRLADRSVRLIDLPGTYSLDPISPDEALTRDLLVGADPVARPDVVVVVVSAADLIRTLYLAHQIRETPNRVVVAVSMGDVARRRGTTVDVAGLSRAMTAPTVAVDGRRGVTADLVEAVGRALAAPMPPPLPAPQEHDDALAAADWRFTRVTRMVEATTVNGERATTPWSDRIDRVAISPVVGPMMFLAVMWLVFQLTTRLAAPLQTLIDRLVSGPVSDGARWLSRSVGLGGTWVEHLLVDGVIAGVGMLLSFAPVMAIMFALLALLEDSGYLARAAVVADRLTRVLNLPGRAFLPLVVGFGCNVPAVAATRILPNARHRLLTVLLVPFTSCTARLAVYVLVATAFFGPHAGNVVFGMYLVSIAMLVAGGALLRATVLRTMDNEDLLIDLPRYQVPHIRLLIASTWTRVAAFLRTAGSVIVAAVVVVWALSAIPVGASDRPGTDVEHSLFGQIAATTAPAFTPAGFGDWHTTGALLVGFVAKEAVVSSWAQTYATEKPDNVRRPGALGESLRADFARSSGGHTTAAVLAFLVFLLGYTPCVATLAAQYREVGPRWTLLGFGFQLAFAWTVAVAVFQIGRLVT